MKNIKKIFRNIGITSLLCLSLVGISSCSNKGENGLSAYEIAVKNGFEGTEEEWLSSLKGTNGTNGLDGEDASSITVNELYDESVKNGYSGTFLDFVKEYLSSDESLSYQMNESLLNVVSITSTWNVKTYNMFGQTSDSQTSAAGSGVFYQLDKEQGNAYILTNYHVLYNASQQENNGISTNIKCFIYGSEYENYAINATYIGGSITYDLAMIKIENSDIIKNSLCKVPNMADESSLFIGQECYAVGNNKSKGISANAGHISILSEKSSYNIDGTVCEVRTTRFDCDINGGNSGGGLFNSNGELIGIVCCKMESTGVEGLCYAISPRIVKNLSKRIYDNYIQTNTTTLDKFIIGCTVQIDESYAYLDENTHTYKINQTLKIVEVTEESLSYNKLMENDKIISASLNGIKYDINTIYDISEILLDARVDDILTIRVKREVDEKSEELDVNITLNNSGLITLN